SAQVGVARSPVRLWVLPHVTRLTRGGDSAVPAGHAPRYGVHPPMEYPPLAVPPEPPLATLDTDRDRRYERKLWWLLLLLLLFALLLTGTNMWPGPAYGE